MRTNRRDRCTEILDLIDRCLADYEANRPAVAHTPTAGHPIAAA
jgi:hypothetical protein